MFNNYLFTFNFVGTPGREPNFEDKARNFQTHATKLADTANMVAVAGGCRNKKTVEEIFKSSKQVMLCMYSRMNASVEFKRLDI